MQEKISQAAEDYLKTIYELSRGGDRATTNQIAERLEIAPASATGMLQKLAAAAPPLVEYQKHRGVALTADGERIALEIIRHHRLIELYLQRALGYTWDEVHAEADRLEHVISEQFEERIAEALGHPLHDPHGEPIPTRDLQLPALEVQRLSSLRAGQTAVIRQVEQPEAGLLRYLAGLGMTPGARLSVLDYSVFDGNLRLAVDGQPGEQVLGERITRRVLVEVGG
jgi:DtxR family Mn-dependent transcriptional regulator